MMGVLTVLNVNRIAATNTKSAFSEFNPDIAVQMKTRLINVFILGPTQCMFHFFQRHPIGQLDEGPRPVTIIHGLFIRGLVNQLRIVSQKHGSDGTR